jgi:transposase
LPALTSRLEAMRGKAARAGKPVRMLSCYEAGWDAHWLHRWLTEKGVINYEVDPSSIEVNRRARQAKTDRIDLDRIMRAFLAYLRGEPRACSMVHVPSVVEEDRKRRNRERDRLSEERTAHSNRINGLLHAQGIRDAGGRCRRDCWRRSSASMNGWSWSTSSWRRSTPRAWPNAVSPSQVRQKPRSCNSRISKPLV